MTDTRTAFWKFRELAEKYKELRHQLRHAKRGL